VNEDKDNRQSDRTGQSPEPGIVCTACLAPNRPHTNYCSKCGALLNSLAAFNPFDQTLVEGFAYRRAVDGPPSKLILIGMWLLFGPSILLVPVIFSDVRLGNEATGVSGPLFEHIYFAAYLLISIVILYRTTANYISKRKDQSRGSA